MQRVLSWLAYAAIVSAAVCASVAHAETNESAVPSMGDLGYSHTAMDDFLIKAKSAEQMDDLLQRCLAYPDPPGSHWTPAAIRTYCHYRYQPFMSANAIQDLLRAHKFTELEVQLNAALKAQESDPNAPSRLNRIYDEAFNADVKGLRPLVDQWKGAIPRSAFAYAASGWLYMDAARTARGEDYDEKTSPAKLEKMKDLMAYAETDLNQSISLDPKMIPAYIALIYGANISENSDYALLYIDRALAVAPADFSIYNTAMLILQPRWHGSIAAMQALANKAQAHAGQNPMLALFKNEAAIYQVDQCQCGEKQQAIRYATLFDELSTSAHMWRVCDAAAVAGATRLATVLCSQTLRFNAGAVRARTQRAMRLTDLGYIDWALREADAAIKQDPSDVAGFEARAYAFEAKPDDSNAERALQQAIHLDSSDVWALVELGNIHFNKHEWDDAWNISSELVTKFPNEATGWILRGNIQMDQPRAGLKNTFDEFRKRFGSDPEWKDRLDQMRDGLEAKK